MREIERRQYAKQLEDDTKEDRVLITTVELFATLHRRVNQCLKVNQPLERLKQQGGAFNRLLQQHGLEDVLETRDLVSFGPTYNCHFSEVIWLPYAERIYVMDSHSPSGHYALTKKRPTEPLHFPHARRRRRKMTLMCAKRS
eukprot:5850714-Prymnesium_polylepis.1